MSIEAAERRLRVESPEERSAAVLDRRGGVVVEDGVGEVSPRAGIADVAEEGDAHRLAGGRIVERRDQRGHQIGIERIGDVHLHRHAVDGERIGHGDLGGGDAVGGGPADNRWRGVGEGDVVEAAGLISEHVDAGVQVAVEHVAGRALDLRRKLQCVGAGERLRREIDAIGARMQWIGIGAQRIGRDGERAGRGRGDYRPGIERTGEARRIVGHFQFPGAAEVLAGERTQRRSGTIAAERVERIEAGGDGGGGRIVEERVVEVGPAAHVGCQRHAGAIGRD